MSEEVQILAPEPSRGDLLALGFERAGWTAAVEPSLERLLARYQKARPRLLVCDDPKNLGALTDHLDQELASEPVPVVAIAERAHRREGLHTLGAPTYLQDVVMLGRLAARRGRRLLLGRGEILLLARALSSSGATGLLRLRRRGAGWTRRAELRISDGEFAGARAGEATGRRAFLRTCVWQAAEADWLVKPVDRTNQIGEGARALVERAAAHVAEWDKQLQQAAPETSILDVDAEGLLSHLKELPDEVNSVVRLCDGTRSLATVVEESHYRDIDTLMILGKLILIGVVTARPPAPLEEDSVHGDSRGIAAITPEMLEAAERAALARAATIETPSPKFAVEDEDEAGENAPEDEPEEDEADEAPAPDAAARPETAAAPARAPTGPTLVATAGPLPPAAAPTGPTLAVPPAPLPPAAAPTGPTTVAEPPAQRIARVPIVTIPARPAPGVPPLPPAGEATLPDGGEPLVLRPAAKGAAAKSPAAPPPAAPPAVPPGAGGPAKLSLDLDLLGAGLERIFGERPPERDEDYDDAEPFLPPEPMEGSTADGLSGDGALAWLERGILRALADETPAEDIAGSAERTLREMPAVVLDASLFGEEGPSALPPPAPERPAGLRRRAPAGRPGRPPPPPPGAVPGPRPVLGGAAGQRPPPPAPSTREPRAREASVDVDLAPTPPTTEAATLKLERAVRASPPTGDLVDPDEAERLRVALPPRRLAMQPIRLPASGAPAQPVPRPAPAPAPPALPKPPPPPAPPNPEPSFATMEKEFFAEGERPVVAPVPEDSFSDLGKPAKKEPKKR